MSFELKRIAYNDLNARQRENYNYHKVSAVLADFGFTTLRLSDDWHGADFIAVHIDGVAFLRVQLKGRLSFDKKYVGRGLHIAFREDDVWYLYPHDELLETIVETKGIIVNSASWQDRGRYSFSGLGADVKQLLEPYMIAGGDVRVAANSM
jgi:hypothetical protein